MATHRRPTTNKNGWKNPHQSETWKKYWARPGIREERAANPLKYSRINVPQGYPREYADLLAKEAGQFADQYMKELEHAGVVRSDDVIVPDSDEAIAKVTLREAVKIALNVATPRAAKLSAINICLNYTKPKPVIKTEMLVKSPEDWLKEALDVSKHSKPSK
jgi:hypothetical protein